MIKHLFYISVFLFFSASCTVSKTVTKEKLAVSENGKSALDNKEEYTAFFKAEKARLLGDRSQAIQLYSEFVKKYRGNATAFFNLANLQMQTFEMSKAERSAAEAVRLDGENKYFAELYADILSRNRKGAQAADIYKRLIQSNPKTSEAYLYKQYFIYNNLGEHAKAIESLNLLEGKIGASEEVVLQKVELLKKLKKTKQAVAEVEKLIKIDPNNTRYQAIIAEIYEESGDKTKAKDMYADLLKQNPNDPKVQMSLANYHYQQGDSVEYKKVLSKIMANEELEVQYKINLLLPLLTRANDSNFASTELLPLIKTMRETHPESTDAKEMYAEMLFYSNRPQEAVQEYRNFISEDKSKFDSWMNLLLAHSSLGNLDSVIEISEEALDYFPNNPALHFYQGTTYIQQDKNDQGIQSLKSALNLEPEKELKAQVFSALGDAHFNKKEYQLSDFNFDESLKLFENPTTLNNYAYYLSLREDKLDEALSMSKKSLALRPGSATFLDTYGWIFYQKGDYQNAKLQLQKAAEADNYSDATILEHLGDAYFKLNDKEKAMEYWLKAQKRGGGSILLPKKVSEGKLYE